MTVIRAPIEIARLLYHKELSNSDFKVIALIGLIRARSHLEPEDNAYLQPTTNNSIIEFCRTKELQHSTVAIDCGSLCPSARLHRITNNNTTKSGNILLYFHGGGYVSPISGIGHLPFIEKCASACQSDESFILEYTLAPSLRYPGQLIQAASAIRFLLKQYKVGQITLGGDSAGGNLILALLGHIKSPHHDVPKIEKVSNTGGHRFRAVYLISPWLTLQYTSPSYKYNSCVDTISAERLSRVTRTWQPQDSTSEDLWANPSRAPPKFWQHLAADKIFVSLGSKEVFYDDIKNFVVELMSASPFVDQSHRKVEYFVGPGEVHVHSAMQAASKTPYTGSSIALLTWLQQI